MACGLAWLGLASSRVPHDYEESRKKLEARLIAHSISVVMIGNQRSPRNPRTGLSQCFPNVLMCSETTALFVRKKRVPKACRKAFVTIKTSLGRPICFAWSEPNDFLTPGSCSEWVVQSSGVNISPNEL
ncbi:hypothetical protein CRG98_009291 [Punica granatum]|uniref:Uncharacterized protein n=1 Tax=Punica granatum TaxID=22663 RepID=A0A2I0KPD3_PUNGR|nr:hypothetical protein CRG98_009291 [Punica granatum]